MPKQYPTELRQRAVRLVAEQHDQYQSEYGDPLDRGEVGRIDAGDTPEVGTAGGDRHGPPGRCHVGGVG
jgi:hypothetical protein